LHSGEHESWIEEKNFVQYAISMSNQLYAHGEPPSVERTLDRGWEWNSDDLL